MKAIQNHNRKEGITYTLAINFYSDFTPKEYNDILSFDPVGDIDLKKSSKKT